MPPPSMCRRRRPRTAPPLPALANSHPSTRTHPVDDTPPFPPMAQAATCHKGITGVTWPFADDDNDMSLAPSHAHATHAVPCSRPVACRRHRPYMPPLPASLPAAALYVPPLPPSQCRPATPTHHLHPTRIPLAHRTMPHARPPTSPFTHLPVHPPACSPLPNMCRPPTVHASHPTCCPPC